MIRIVPDGFKATARSINISFGLQEENQEEKVASSNLLPLEPEEAQLLFHTIDAFKSLERSSESNDARCLMYPLDSCLESKIGHQIDFRWIDLFTYKTESCRIFD
jgi:hypothetical protein